MTRYVCSRLMALLIFTGSHCAYAQTPETDARPDPEIQDDEARAAELYTFTLHSVPSGAEVYRLSPSTGEAVLIGQTPLVFPLEIQRVEADGLRGAFGRRVLEPVVSDELPLSFRETDEHAIVALPQLELRHPAYQPEAVEYEWTFPPRMRVRGQGLRVEPVPSAHEVTVYFRDPTAPQHSLSVTIESSSSKARVYTVLADESIGQLIGTTPLTSVVHFAEVRSSEGEVVNWKRWNPDHAGLWTHNPAGELYLNAYLVVDGYEPERFHNRWVAHMTAEPEQTARVVLQPLRRDQPEADFLLQVDSLPAGAALYAVRADGSWGRNIGNTPLQIKVGFAEDLEELSPGHVVHGGWSIWAPEEIIRWRTDQSDVTSFYLIAAVYKEGFATEQIVQPLFQLHPELPYPEEMVLTIPLLRPEQAAARDAQRQQSERPGSRTGASGLAQPGRRSTPSSSPQREGASGQPTVDYIWRAPSAPQPQASDHQEPETLTEEAPGRAGLLSRFRR